MAEPSQPQHDERNDQVLGDESASLLPSGENSPPPGLSPPKAIYVLSSLALSFSTLSIVCLIATRIALAVVSGDFSLGRDVRSSLPAIIAPAIFSLLATASNLARLRRGLEGAFLFFNIIIDIVTGIVAIIYGAAGLAGTNGSFCYRYWDPAIDYDSCMRRALPARIFAGIALGSAVVFGTVHLVMLLVRLIVAYRANFWKGPWGFPDGQLTVELSLKLFKEPQKPREVGTEAV